MKWTSISTPARANSSPRELAFPDLVTVPELAEGLRTSPKAVYTMVERNMLPGVVRIGRRLLFRRDALLQWLSESGAPSP